MMIINDALCTERKYNLFGISLEKRKKPQISSLCDKPRSLKLLLSSLAIASFVVIVLCCFFPPRWEANDDVGMSMIAHGYGIAVIGSPNILFSNVLWGYLIRAIPEINGVLGYSIATLSVLVIFAMVVIYGMLQRRVSYVACLSTLALILVRPVLFPQFTINAGLLLIGAIVCWDLYAQHNDRLTLVAGCLLALLSYLVRGPEFFLVLIVALPLIPWRRLLFQRSGKIAILVLISALTVSAIIDRQAYRGDEWKSFNELNSARAPFTDYGAGSILKLHSDIFKRYGYSINDIALIEGWFFVDSHIANPQALQSMLAELGPLPTQGNALTKVWSGVQNLWNPVLLTSFLAALFLAALRPSWQIAASWGLCIAAVVVLGLLGRPGVLHVYVPLVCLLLVAPFLRVQVSGWRNRLCICVLLVAAIVNTSYVFSESKNLQISAQQARKDLATFPHFPVVIWGATFPYEAAYPVLGASASSMSYQHYGLGTSTLAPFTVSYSEQKAGRGMTDLLAKEGGIPIMANPAYLQLLEVYCKEHLHGHLKVLSEKKYGSLEVSQCRCEVSL